MAISWLNGVPFHKLFDDLVNSGAKYKAGSKLWDYSVERIVDVCENGFGYEGILLLGALIELLPALQIENIDILISSLQYLQKNLRYGLPDQTSITLYELGFADRIVALELSSIFREIQPTKESLLQALKVQREEAFTILNKYPSYFSQVYENVAT
ncbi:MAG: hypothetical protein HKUEN02_20940 [Anaerolineaceae bacterium]|nr:MAG: hypothetical protein HKUEN02_20940 [Anaerolineaceae bacterium]